MPSEGEAPGLARKIVLSALALVVAFCIGLSLIALSGVLVIIQSNGAVPLP